MKRIALVILLFFSTAVSSFAAEKKMALVMGVSGYTYLTDLPRSNKDALDVGRMYDRQDFDVTWATDIKSTAALKKAIATFSDKVKAASKNHSVKAVLYYSGHGIEAAGGNWFLGPDFDPRKVNYDARKLYEKYAYDAKVAIDSIVKAGAKSTLFVLDACRTTGIKVRGGKSLRPGYDTRIFGTVPNFVMLYSAASGSVAYDNPSTPNDNTKNSVFTHYFLQNAESNQDISQLADKLQTEVAAATRGKEVTQHPSYYDGYSGSYFLFDTDVPRGVSQSGPVVRIFYRDGRSSEASRLARVMEQNGFFYSLVPDDLSDIKAKLLRAGTNRIVSQTGMTSSEASRLERVRGFISLMDDGVMPRAAEIPPAALLAKPFQIQMF